jgi:myo-inositol-1-phosphate synthase
MPPLRIAIVGLGNCASALVQGVHYYSKNGQTCQNGLVRPMIGGYQVSDLTFALAYDVDMRKVGWSIKQAIFKGTNCCMDLSPDVINDESGRFDGPVIQAPIIDGVAKHMSTSDIADKERFFVSTGAAPPVDVMHHAEELKTYGIDVLINYLPVGSQLATEYWALACLMARVPMVNCIPVFIASNPTWSERFRENKVALIGDDMKSQFGASVLSQAIQELAEARGHTVKVHIQQNSGGNTDFLNMTDQTRLASKKISKENVIRDHGTPPGFLHAGPSDYIRAYGDKKVAHFRVELEGFCGSPVILDARLEVQDSPNSAGVVIDAVRYVRTAQNNGIYGALDGPSAFTQKSPPSAMKMADAIEACDFIASMYE